MFNVLAVELKEELGEAKFKRHDDGHESEIKVTLRIDKCIK